MNLASFLKISKFWNAKGQKLGGNSDKIPKIQRYYWTCGIPRGILTKIRM